METVTTWLMDVCESETSQVVYRSMIEAFRSFVAENYGFDINEFKERWRKAKYGSVREREKFLDFVADVLEGFKVWLKQRVAPTTLRSYMSCVQSFLKRGCGIKEVDSFLPKRAYIIYHNRDITKEEIRKILEHAPLRERLFFLMMAESGLRPRTLVQLRYKHIKEDFEAGRIPMKIELPAYLLKDRVSDRFTFVGEDSVKLLREYLSLRPKLDDEDLIFEPDVKSRAKKPYLSPETFSNAFNDIVKKLGLAKGEYGKPKPLRLYCLRKYFFNNCLANTDFKNFWFCHSSVNDHYISRDVERHRQEYAKAYPYLRIYEPHPLQQTIEQQAREIQALREQLNQMQKRYEEAMQTIELLKKTDLIQFLIEFYKKHPELLKSTT